MDTHASSVSQPLLQPNAPEVSRHPGLERGDTAIEEPFTPEQVCSRLTGLLGFPRNDACAEPWLGGQDRLILRDDEVLAIGSRKAD